MVTFYYFIHRFKRSMLEIKSKSPSVCMWQMAMNPQNTLTMPMEHWKLMKIAV